MKPTEPQVAANTQTKPVDLDWELSYNWLLLSTPIIAIYCVKLAPRMASPCCLLWLQQTVLINSAYVQHLNWT